MFSVLYYVKSNLKLFKAVLFTVCLLTAWFSKRPGNVRAFPWGVHTCRHLKGLEAGSLPWGGACFLPSRPPSPKSRVPDGGAVLGWPPPAGPLVLWSELIFKRNFRSVSRSGSPSVDRVFAALPRGSRGAGCPACQPQGPVTEEPRAGEAGERSPWGQPGGPPETLVAPARGPAAVGQGVARAEWLLSLTGFLLTAALASWPGNTAAVLSRPWHLVTISFPSSRFSPRIAPCNQLRSVSGMRDGSPCRLQSA